MDKARALKLINYLDSKTEESQVITAEQWKTISEYIKHLEKKETSIKAIVQIEANISREERSERQKELARQAKTGVVYLIGNEKLLHIEK